jgi:hypothetical protein
MNPRFGMALLAKQDLAQLRVRLGQPIIQLENLVQGRRVASQTDSPA